MKSFETVSQGKPVEGALGACLTPLQDRSFDPVRDGRLITGCPPGRREALTDVRYLLALFQYRTLVSISRTGKLLAKARESERSPEDAWNRCAQQLYLMTCVHVRYFIFEKFVVSLEACEDANCREVLKRLAVVFALSDIQCGEQWLGLLQYEEALWAGELLEEACQSLRPDVVPLTDAFDFPDRILNSAIGRSDGRVYEALFEEAKRSALNLKADGSHEDIPIFVKSLESRFDKDILALRNGLPSTPAKL